MALPHVLQQVINRPEMYLSSFEFDVAAALIQGFDLASSGGLLSGFREWLVMRVDCGSNLAWTELVLRLAFPGSEVPRQKLESGGDQERHAANLLFRLLEEFWREKESPNGLRRIHLRYQAWLRHQDWYGPMSPDYFIEDCGNGTERDGSGPGAANGVGSLIDACPTPPADDRS